MTTDIKTVLVLEHDAGDPLLKMESWLSTTDVELDVRKLHQGDAVPESTAGFDGIISLGGDMGAHDDEIAPWLPATKALLAAAVLDRTPTLGICLGSQLLAVATGGTVVRAADGPEVGAYLTAKRDAAQEDPLFADLPMTPDVMHYHYDIVDKLPPGAVLLLSSTGYQNQAWRVGTAAWGLQFHIEPSAADLRKWADNENREHTARFGEMLDAAEAEMDQVWRAFIHRFVALIHGRVHPGLRLPLLAPDSDELDHIESAF
ncbi:type 1 glutamine amidotransferase [Nakamurella antarctica]|uniref:Type 1 glutamine amidotransferase n=1 Tax=Nakamurella antarctica TaxID=1902245 RepID=A0A3G8ZTL7_9ACTN|nr:type 1 glutamine amidotransferase [Nakamurella antarctica]AZI57814.1 type 1 glutamine amidotransferase [Nakamurella antarctica]